MINIVLCEPEIPYNTGNIGRTCFLTKSRLHLIRPFPFQLDDKRLKRAGLDYWQVLDPVIHDSFQDFLQTVDGNIYYATSKGERVYTEVSYEDGDYIVFGSESKGLNSQALAASAGRRIRIPLLAKADRSLNLSNSVAIILYEALRQLNFTVL